MPDDGLSEDIKLLRQQVEEQREESRRMLETLRGSTRGPRVTASSARERLRRAHAAADERAAQVAAEGGDRKAQRRARNDHDDQGGGDDE